MQRSFQRASACMGQVRSVVGYKTESKQVITRGDPDS